MPEIRSLLVDLRRLNTTSTRVQAKTLAVLRESLTIQRETLTHVRSLDDKTLGPAPAAVLPGEVSIGRLAWAAPGENRSAPPTSRVAAPSAPPPGLHSTTQKAG